MDRQGIDHIQLAHNTRYPEKGCTGSNVASTFGRRGQLYVLALKRIVSSLSHFICHGDPRTWSLRVQVISSSPAGLKGSASQRVEGTHLAIDQCHSKALKDRELTIPVGDAIFADTHTLVPPLRWRWKSGPPRLSIWPLNSPSSCSTCAGAWICCLNMKRPSRKRSSGPPPT
jgi:hypothetical protein